MRYFGITDILFDTQREWAATDDPNAGNAIYQDGVGTAPTPTNTTGYEVGVTSVPGAACGIQTITFKMKGEKKGKWQNCAEMTSNLFQGIAISCANGEVK